MPGSAGDFYERGKKLEPLAKLVPIDGIGYDILVVGDHPANFVNIAITPQDSTDRPDIRLRAAVRTGSNRRATIQREGNYVIGRCGHVPN